MVTLYTHTDVIRACPTFGACIMYLCLTHPIERIVEPGKGEEQNVGVEGGERRPERLHDAEDEMKTVKGHQP